MKSGELVLMEDFRTDEDTRVPRVMEMEEVYGGWRGRGSGGGVES